MRMTYLAVAVAAMGVVGSALAVDQSVGFSDGAQFAARCRAEGQKGAVAWIGQATSMEKVRPRDGFAARPAKKFALAAARGEKESLQVFVLPATRDLRKIAVRVSDLRSDRAPLASSCFKASPVGYVNVTNPASYQVGRNVVSTNAPTGVVRERVVAETGWWPDPILDYLDCADVARTDLQGFWVRFSCPRDQQPGTYRGALTVAGEGWSEEFPLEVRVWDFEVPKASPLPLAITFAPGVRPLTENAPSAPCHHWTKHRAAWVDMLADYYITFDNIYNRGAVPIEDWRRLEGQGRLGLVNVGYWSYPKGMDEVSRAEWECKTRHHLDTAYAAVNANGWLERAYLYGCDEVKPEFFPNIRYAIDKLKAWYPGVPLFTTAYDYDFGVGTPLERMDWFTPLTTRYVEHFAKVAPARAAGHRVWWYICCIPRAPRANMFVEAQAIEGRLLMGAQTVKWRPDGFLYYQTAVWSATQSIEGPSTFTTWEPTTWANYHGDGSWFCAGPDGSPCATIRIENFRDGLEDYAYALEYERVTGESCPVPERITADIGVYTDDPEIYYAWRNDIAERIEAARRDP